VEGFSRLLSWRGWNAVWKKTNKGKEQKKKKKKQEHNKPHVIHLAVIAMPIA